MSHFVSNWDSTYTLHYIVISAPVNSSYLFSGFKKVTAIENINYLDTSKVTNMSNLFNNNNSLISLDLSSFDMSKVTNTGSMLGYTIGVIAGYARIQADADIFNAIESKPSTYSFVVLN